MNLLFQLRILSFSDQKFLFHRVHFIRKISNILIGLTNTIIDQIDQPINIRNLQILQQIRSIVVLTGMVMLILGKMSLSFVFLACQLLEVLVGLKFSVRLWLRIEQGFACILLVSFVGVGRIYTHGFMHFFLCLLGAGSFLFVIGVRTDLDFLCGG